MSASTCPHPARIQHDSVPARVDARYACGRWQRGVDPASSVFEVGDCPAHGDESIDRVAVVEWRPRRAGDESPVIRCGRCGRSYVTAAGAIIPPAR
jgi:hypothetical protein